jgi:hypothetical protein
VRSVFVDTRAGRALQREPWGFASYRGGAGGVIGEDLRVCASVDCGRYDPEGASGHCAGGILLEHKVKEAFILLIK